MRILALAISLSLLALTLPPVSNEPAALYGATRTIKPKKAECEQKLICWWDLSSPVLFDCVEVTVCKA